MPSEPLKAMEKYWGTTDKMEIARKLKREYGSDHPGVTIWEYVTDSGEQTIFIARDANDLAGARTSPYVKGLKKLL